jgi:hypothetical protein
MARIKSNLSYVFLHPAWRGAWCWDRVVSLMEGWGRKAYAIDCPGHPCAIENRAHTILTRAMCMSARKRSGQA